MLFLGYHDYGRCGAWCQGQSAPKPLCRKLRWDHRGLVKCLVSFASKWLGCPAFQVVLYEKVRIVYMGYWVVAGTVVWQLWSEEVVEKVDYYLCCILWCCHLVSMLIHHEVDSIFPSSLQNCLVKKFVFLSAFGTHCFLYLFLWYSACFCRRWWCWLVSFCSCVWFLCHGCKDRSCASCCSLSGSCSWIGFFFLLQILSFFAKVVVQLWRMLFWVARQVVAAMAWMSSSKIHQYSNLIGFLIFCIEPCKTVNMGAWSL